jgi:hypothetical protein
MSQHECALEISRAVEPAGEAEMALQVGAGGLKQIKDFVICGRHVEG